jgi:hypothetical protein
MKIGRRIFGVRWSLARPILLGVAIALVVFGYLIGPELLFNAVFHRNVRGPIFAALLRTLLGLYLAGLVVAISGVFLLGRRVLRARRRRERATREARLLAACVSFLFGALLLEGLSAVWLARAHRIALPEPRFPPRSVAGEPSANDLYIVVLGGSTALGGPFDSWLSGRPLDSWLSIGQIVGWKLEGVFPGRRVVVDIRAVHGYNLEKALRILPSLTRRPDAILLYSGHNEFQGFYKLSRAAVYYADEVSFRSRATLRLLRLSSLSALIVEAIDRHELGEMPESSWTRSLVDSPACTPRERQQILDDYRARLGGFVDYCEKAGSLPIVFVPAGNDGGFDPNRSVLLPETTRPGREEFARAFRETRALEDSDPEKCMAAYRSLLAEQPVFAEAHYRLARLLERKGAFAEANEHYVQARDNDALPFRCPSDFRAAVLELAKRKDCLVIDAEEVLRPLCPRGILNEQVFTDAHHPHLTGYVALSRELLKRLQARRAFGWPDKVPPPPVTTAEVAAHFGLTPAKWAEVCERQRLWYIGLAKLRYDPTDRIARMESYGRAVKAIAKGVPPEDAGVPGLGVPKSVGVPDR